MRRSAFWACILLCLLSPALRSQNAPITTVGSVLNAVAGSVTVPVTVTNFTNIGTVSLTLDYNTASLTFVSAVQNPAMSSNFSVNSSVPGRVSFSWFGSGLTFPDNTHLVDITFTFTSGTSTLTFFDNGGSCQYADGSNNILNDLPYSTYYINGVITNLAAPVTFAPIVTNAVNGTVNAPITVNRFINIKTIALTLEYDQWVLTYLTITPDPALGGTLNTSTALVGGKMRLTISWFAAGSGITLGDGSVIFTIGFTFTSNNRSFSELKWIDTGGSCEYSNGNSEILYDTPTGDFYKNGLIATQLAPKTYLPTITTATAGSIIVPVTVDNFTNTIGSISLRFEYDPSVMTFSSFSQNTSLSVGMLVGDAAGTGGKRLISIAWIGTSPGLSNGSYLVNITFTYISGTTPLKFIDNGVSCEYGNLQFKALYDKPQSSYYIDGVVTFGTAPVTIAPDLLAVVNTTIHVPVTVNGFTNIGTLSLNLDYDPGVLTYLNTVPNPSLPGLPGSFSATVSTPGRLTLSWYGSGTTFSNGTELAGIDFTYKGGTSPLAWYDNGGSCQYSNGSLQVLYDLPQSTYYINGQVSRMPLDADFSANNTLPQVNETVTFSDLSAGGPLTWAWSFSPGTFNFVNSTTSGSQNPQVQFTAKGKYTATLTVTNAYESNTETKTYYIHVGCNGCWTGITSTEWGTESNWDNYLIPSALTDVTIPDAAPYWPVYTTNFTLGTLCRSITMVGNAQMNVNGNFTIEAGARLDFTGTGTFRVTGNWLNYGIFNCGTGTVEFPGEGPSVIPGGIFPATDLKNYTRSTFTGAMVPLTSLEAGPAGDNGHMDLSIGFNFTYLGVTYSTLRINTNGWISLNQSGTDGESPDNSRLFTSGDPNTTLAPWWDDLLADGSSAVSWIGTGFAPDRVFKVEWKNVLAYSADATARINFQVFLYETSNVIEFIYGTVVAGTHNAAESASIGIEDATGGTGRFIEATTGSMTTGKSDLKSASNWPTVNYRFTPPPEKNTFYNLKVLKTNAAVTNEGNIIVLKDVTIE